jgi:hypothetical protein
MSRPTKARPEGAISRAEIDLSVKVAAVATRAPRGDCAQHLLQVGDGPESLAGLHLG